MGSGDSALLPGHVPNIVIRFLAFLFMPIVISVGAYVGLLGILALLVPCGFIGSLAVFILLTWLFAVFVFDPHNQLITTRVVPSLL
jgi:uncharacterized RDD family membrane protein YckC